jgi:hypothetical protein
VFRRIGPKDLQSTIFMAKELTRMTSRILARHQILKPIDYYSTGATFHLKQQTILTMSFAENVI